MRRILLLLPLCAAATAEQPYQSALRAFEKARETLHQPGAQARVLVAVDDLAATLDKRAARHLAAFVVQTMTEENATFDRIKTMQQEGAKVYNRRMQIDREIRHLRLKERAGDRTVGPEIEKRVNETQKLDRTFETIKRQVERQSRFIDYLRDMRDRAREGAATVVMKQADSEDATEAAGSLFRSLDVVQREQGLHLVRILRACPRPETEPYLVRILEHPKASPGVRRNACYALGAVLGRTGADALVTVARSNVDGLRRAALHTLSLAAKRRIPDVEQAAEFAKTLP